MQQDNPPPPDTPKGLLYILDPQWAHLIPEEHRFDQKVEQAWQDGVLYIPVDATRMQ